MKMRVISYLDRKLNVYLPPVFVQDCSDEDLIENVRRMVSNPKVPDVYFEYDLYSLGSYDDKTGVISAKSPDFLVSLGDFRHLKSKEVIQG